MHPNAGQNIAQQHVIQIISHMPTRIPPAATPAWNEDLSGDCPDSIILNFDWEVLRLIIWQLIQML